jgi:hypothetical protein
LVCAAIAGFEAWQDYRARDRELAKIASTNTNLVRSVLQHAEDTIEMADTVLIGLQERLEADGMSAAAVTRLNQLLALAIKSLPRIKNMFVYGEDGRWLASSVPNFPPDLNNSDREYFQRLKASPDSGPYVGFPVHSRSTGEWIIPIARASRHVDGSFAGVVNATVTFPILSIFIRGSMSASSARSCCFAATGRSWLGAHSGTMISAATCPAACCSPSSCRKPVQAIIAPSHQSTMSTG